MSNDKAPGTDGITAEVLKLGGEPIMLVLTPMYEAVMGCGIVPAQWNVPALQLIYKGKGDKEDIKTTAL